MSDTAFPKDQVAVLERQIDRLRKEGDDRMSSNHTLWRAGLAGIAALILFKENLDVSRFVVLLPLLCMAFAAHWMNLMLMLYRAGDAMASCEIKINNMANAKLLEHELTLCRMRQRLMSKRHKLIIIAAFAASGTYWFAIGQARPSASVTQAVLLWQAGLAASALVHIVAMVNLKRLLGFDWPLLKAAEESSTSLSEERM